MLGKNKQYTWHINYLCVLIYYFRSPNTTTYWQKKHFNLSSTSLSLQIDLQKVYPVPECCVSRGVSSVYLLTMGSAIKKYSKMKISNFTVWEEFEDTKEVIIIRSSKKDRQHNGQKKKRTNNDLQNITHKKSLKIPKG
jgi:hypothetical protein